MDQVNEFFCIPSYGVAVEDSAAVVVATIDIYNVLGQFIDSCRNATDAWRKKFTQHVVHIHSLYGHPFDRILDGMRNNYNDRNLRHPSVIGKSFAIVTIPMTFGEESNDVVCLIPIHHNLHAISYYIFNKACGFDTNDHGNYVIPLGVPAADFDVKRLIECVCKGFAIHDNPSTCSIWTTAPDHGPRRAEVLGDFIENPTRYFKLHDSIMITLRNALGFNQTVSRESVVKEEDGASPPPPPPPSANVIKMYCAAIDVNSISSIKDKLVQFLTPNFLLKKRDEEKAKIINNKKNPPPHVTLAVFKLSEYEKSKLETYLTGQKKLNLPKFVNKEMTIDVTRKFGKYGRNIVGVSVDCDINLRQSLLTLFSGILEREVTPFDNRFNPHISLGEMVEGKCEEVLCMTPAMAPEIQDEKKKNYHHVEASTFILGEIGGRSEPIEFTIENTF